MQEKPIADANVVRRHYKRLPIRDERDVANECFIENAVDQFAVVRSAIRLTSNARAFGVRKLAHARRLARTAPCRKRQSGPVTAVCDLLRRAANHAEAYILFAWLVRSARVRRLIGAAANGLAFAVGRQNPFGDVAAEVEDQLFVAFALAREAAHWLQKRRDSAQLRQFLLQSCGVFRI